MGKKVIPDNGENQYPDQDARTRSVKDKTRREYKNIPKSRRSDQQTGQKYGEKPEQEEVTAEDHMTQFQKTVVILNVYQGPSNHQCP